MFYALDKTRVRVPIELADKKNRYHCPCCNRSVIVKQGKINAWHYAHEPGSDCDASFSEMTAWHKAWQERFPEECREGIVEDITGYKRIADVKISNITIEFQTRSIPKDVFDARNRHHIRASKEVLWVFNCLDKEIWLTRKVNEEDGTFNDKYWARWAYPNRLLAKYSYYTWGKRRALQDKDSNEWFNNIVIFLQWNEKELLQLLYVHPLRENMGSFLCRCIGIDDFVRKISEEHMKPMQLAIEI